jgi:hypothetical protein
MRQIPLRDCSPLAQLCGSHPQICSTVDAPCCRYMASSNSPFSYYRLREWRQTTEQASSRRKALWWDVFSSGDRKRALQTVLNHSVLGRLPLAGPGSLWHLMRPDGPLPLPPNTTYMPPSLTRAQRRRTGVPSADSPVARCRVPLDEPLGSHGGSHIQHAAEEYFAMWLTCRLGQLAA